MLRDMFAQREKKVDASGLSETTSQAKCSYRTDSETTNEDISIGPANVRPGTIDNMHIRIYTNDSIRSMCS